VLTESTASLLEEPTAIVMATDILAEAHTKSRAATARSSFRALRARVAIEYLEALRA